MSANHRLKRGALMTAACTRPASSASASAQITQGPLFCRIWTRVLNVKDGHRPGPDCVYIGRFHKSRGLFLPASKWRNPYRIGDDATRDQVIDKYRAYLLTTPRLLAALPELCSKDLLCWCAPERCHGEVLIELANA